MLFVVVVVIAPNLCMFGAFLSFRSQLRYHLLRALPWLPHVITLYFCLYITLHSLMLPYLFMICFPTRTKVSWKAAGISFFSPVYFWSTFYNSARHSEVGSSVKQTPRHGETARNFLAEICGRKNEEGARRVGEPSDPYAHLTSNKGVREGRRKARSS